MMLDQRLIHTPGLDHRNLDLDGADRVTYLLEQSFRYDYPGPVQQRAITATVVDITPAGVTVRFRTKRALLGAQALDPDDRYVVNALYEYTPPPPA